MSRSKPVPKNQPFTLAQKPSYKAFRNLESRRFGHITVIGYAGVSGHNHLWACECDCGTRIYILGSNLTRGNTASCGCLHSARTRVLRTTHGKNGTPEYVAHQSMIARCRRPSNNKHYERGIAVCDRWLNGQDGVGGFECFLRDMGPRPSARHSLDRIDNDGNYAPENCRWATRSQQNANTTRNRFVVYRGTRMILQDAARSSGINRRTITQRLEHGWSAEEALETPPRR